MSMSRQQNAGQNQKIETVIRSFENAAKFRYVGTTVEDRYLIQEEIKSSPNSGNACYRSVLNL
jgi:hypothetical protein